MLRTYVCDYVIDHQRYSQIVQARSPMEAKRIINGQLQNIGKIITHFQVKEIK
jgi:hypothetical protein